MQLSDERLLKALMEHTRELVVVTDAAECILHVNPRFCRVLGYSEEEACGHELLTLASGSNPDSLLDLIAAELEAGREWAGELWLRSRDGKVYLFDTHITPLDDGQRLLLLRDVLGDTEQNDESLQRDRLTGLPNRILFRDRIDQAVINARRDDKSLAVLSLGIDRFIRINDGLGHAYGDALLAALAVRLSTNVRTSDTIARLGGDRFGLAMAVTQENDSVLVAEKLLTAMSEPFEIDGREVALTASIGISLYPGDAEDADGMIKNADSAMRHAKRSGRDGFQFYASDMNDKARRRIEMESRLRRAIDHDELLLYYQPKVSVVDGSIVGAEALIRWQDPEQGMINPGEFIPVAEESGLINPIGSWVMAEACRQNSRWQAEGLKPVCVSVNVAVPQFRDPRLIERVAEVLQESGLLPQLLELEITESMLMGNAERTIEKLHQLRALGIKLAIDDFGTGYSSLSYLSRFPITTLKIDRAFIHDLESNRHTEEIARAIIGLSRGLDLEVVAEGAENAAHIKFLRDQGCATVQGFYYSRPVPAGEFAEMLRAGSIVREG